MDLRNRVPFFMNYCLGYMDTISGTSPLSLPKAKANSLQYVKAFGGTEQNGTPTPDAPVDIVSNNGTIKARHQSGLPLGYTLLEYIETASGSYIDTGITPTINAKADVKFAPTQTSATGYWGARRDPNRFCCTTFSSGTKFGIGMTNNTWPANRTPVTLESIYDCVVANGYASVDGAEYTETPVESFGNAGTFYLGRTGAAKYYKCKLWENNVLVFDGIPAKNANDVIGMYDLVSGQFFTNQGTGTFTAGTAVSDPVEIYTDGTVETVNVHGKNLFDSTPYKIGYYINASGQEVEATSYQDEYLIRQAIVQPSTQYTVSFVGVNSSYTQRFHTYDKDGNWIAQITTLNPSVGNTTKYTFTTPVNCKYVRQGGRSQSNYQLELGSTATEYEEYFDGGTATAEMLLKVGNYQDVQSVLDGGVIHRCGIKVFDGTENWTNPFNNGRFILFFPSAAKYGVGASANLYCSHFEAKVSAASSLVLGCGFYTNTLGDPPQLRMTYPDMPMLSDFKQYLADQYAQGTPVIVIYPLATPTTETVTGQTLQVQKGTNILQITQASMDDLKLEATYRRNK